MQIKDQRDGGSTVLSRDYTYRYFINHYYYLFCRQARTQPANCSKGKQPRKLGAPSFFFFSCLVLSCLEMRFATVFLHFALVLRKRRFRRCRHTRRAWLSCDRLYGARLDLADGFQGNRT